MHLDEPLSDKDEPADRLNTLLTNNIGYGHAQQKLTRTLYLLLFSEGCETIVLGLLLPILTQEWTLSTFEQSLLITVVYFGVSVGSYIQVYSDRYGRYCFILWDCVLQTVFGLFSCVCWNYSSFLFARFFYGVGIGICLPLSASYITQISPSYMRATLLSKSRVYWSAGCLATCFMAWLLLERSWRLLLFIICLPGIYALVEHKMHGRESLRYLWVQKRREEVHELVTYMCGLNERPTVGREQLAALMEQDLGEHEHNDIPLMEMFNTKYYASSVRLLSSWFAVCFIYYGIMILLPTILQRVFSKNHASSNFKYFFLVAISVVELLSFAVSSRIMDNPDIGRKRGVYYGLAIILAVSIAIIALGEDNIPVLFVGFAIIKFIASATFMILYPYTAEIYETMIRGKALGICSMSGRIATTLLGMVGVYAMKWADGNGLYILFILLSAISGYGAYTMPYCTGNRPIT